MGENYIISPYLAQTLLLQFQPLYKLCRCISVGITNQVEHWLSKSTGPNKRPALLHK